jgi:hypothetical protein
MDRQDSKSMLVYPMAGKKPEAREPDRARIGSAQCGSRASSEPSRARFSSSLN